MAAAYCEIIGKDMLVTPSGETQALNRKLVLLEDELQRSESKLATTTADLSEASTRADDINKAIKVLETKNMIDEERKCDHFRFLKFLSANFPSIASKGLHLKPTVATPLSWPYKSSIEESAYYLQVLTRKPKYTCVKTLDTYFILDIEYPFR